MPLLMLRYSYFMSTSSYNYPLTENILISKPYTVFRSFPIIATDLIAKYLEKNIHIILI